MNQTGHLHLVPVCTTDESQSNEKDGKFAKSRTTPAQIPEDLYKKVVLEFVLRVARGDDPSLQGLETVAQAFRTAQEQGCAWLLVNRMNYMFGLCQSPCRIRLGSGGADQANGKKSTFMLVDPTRQEPLGL